MRHREDPLADAATVMAARTGDRRARERLVAAYLPLVYNVVGRAVNGHPDADDIVQETMLKALDGLPGLRDPERFRSWLLAIALNEVRRRWARRGPDPDDLTAVPDPGGDFVSLAILRLGLSGQRRETAEATRWLDEDDRELLALWWQESAGRITRAELAAVLEVPEAHAAVRVQRMKERLDLSRHIVRALAAGRCPGLSDVTAGWDGRPSPLWRKRIGRHLRDCARCQRARDGLAPAEGLLVGMAMIAPPPIDTTLTGATPLPRPWLKPAIAGGAAIGVAALALLLWPGGDADPQSPPVAAASSSSASAAPEPSRSTVNEGGRPSPAEVSPGAALVEAVNAERRRAGCDDLAFDERLASAALKHAQDMADHGFFDHTGSDGSSTGDRITATGYSWRSWAENIYRGSDDPGKVTGAWMNSDGHRKNMLACGSTEAGAAAVDAPQGTLWVLVLATPA
ncbi:hypothetical protein Afil01_29200 [Actinorhabdospora filicis]|uniref:RNA polymerase sigma factor n=1 Tax=Actinorhabdospora filicis TaxID=1785913 RepID=A0A9W6W9L3_9ACTN|nr:sigma-70 family RNA polymerase sigma factor [Actinorhabdospora filicis]GLZ78113.1 hypothetical protein Afil01_29200 [Actinorhabdospora filicis]